MRIAAGILTWQDGPELLGRAIDSVAAVADELILCDGVVTGIDRGTLPALTTEWPPRLVGTHLLTRRDYTQSVKRNCMLWEARRLGCDWLLSLDADERYHEGRVPLRTLLASWPGDAFPLRFRHGFDGVHIAEAPAAWKLIRVAAWQGWVAGSCYLQHCSGGVYLVLGSIDAAPEGYLPRVTHHPGERPPARRAIRLGPLEFELEPAPADALELPALGFAARSLLQPSARPTIRQEGGTMSTVATYYCPQCGARFAGPGTCENGHPAAEVQPLDATAAAEIGQDPAVSEDAAAKVAEVTTPTLTAAPPLTEPPVPAAAVPEQTVAEQILAGIRDGLDHLEALVGGKA